MYKKEFDAIKKDFKAYLFWGEEPYYIQKYSQMVQEELEADENKMVSYFDEYDFNTAKNYLSQASLFGDRNLLIIKHEKALPKKELQELIAICNKTPNSFLIVEIYSNEGKKISSLFDKKHKSAHVRFFKIELSEAKRELLKFCKQKRIDIDSFALEHLLVMLDNNIQIAQKELEKLSILGQQIQIKDVDRLIYPLNPLSLEKLYIAIIKKEPIYELFQKIIEEEHNEMKILLGFENFIQQLFLFYSFIRLHGNIDSSQILGYKLPKQIESERVALAIKIKHYPRIFLLLQECELLLKTKTNIDKNATLLSYLIKIQALF